MNPRSQKFLHIVPLLLILAMFLMLGFYRLTSVEPEWDEATNIDFAVTLLNGHNPFMSNQLFLAPSVGMPPMTCFYTGSFVLFLKIPAILMFGTSLFAIRAAFVILAALGLAALYYSMRYLFSAPAALLCTLLTATNTLFIRAARMSSEHEEIATLSLFWLGSALLCSFAKHKKTIYAGLAGLVWGVAVFTKLLAGIYLAGLVVAFMLFRKKIMNAVRPDRKHIAVFALMFVIGVFPFINYAIVNDEMSRGIKTLISGSGPDTGEPLGERFKIRIGHLEDFLRQSNITDHVNPEKGVPPVLPVTVIVLCLFLLGSKRQCRPETKAAIMTVFIMAATVFAALLFTPQNNTPAHMLALIPFIEILAAIVLHAALTAKTRQLKIFLFAFLIAGGLYSLANEARMLRNYFVMSRRSGTQKHSEQEVINYIRRNNITPIYAAHMRKGKTLIRYLYPGLPAKLMKLPSGKADIYILHGQTNADSNIALDKIAQKHGLHTETIQRFSKSPYCIYKVALKDHADMVNLLKECGSLNYIYADRAASQ